MTAPTATAAKGGSALSKKVGPLPLGMWIVIGGGGFVVYYVMKSKSTSSATPQVSAADAVGAGAGGWIATTPTTTTTTTAYGTNDQWGQAAISYLIGQNYDAGLSDAAIRNYLGGLQVSIQQQPLVDAALKQLGEPPQLLNPITGPVSTTPIPGPSAGGGTTNTPPPSNNSGGGLFGALFGFIDQFLGGVSGSVSNLNIPVNGQNVSVSGSYGNDQGTISIVNPDGSIITGSANPSVTSLLSPTTTPVATTTGTRTYTVIAGDTLTSISNKMYGSSLQQDKIANANLSVIADRDHLVAGTVLTIPE